ELPVADIAASIWYIHAARVLQAESLGHEGTFAAVVHKLIEANEHLDAHVHGHIVARTAREGIATRAGGSNLIRVRNPERRLDGSNDTDGAGQDALNVLSLRDEPVQVAHLLCRFCLRKIDLYEAGEHGGGHVSLRVGTVDP